jgi:BolA protein
MINTIKKIETLITKKFSPTHLQIIDDSAKHIGHASNRGGGHFRLIIASKEFEEKKLIACHKEIYTALDEMMRHEIHALSIKIVRD